MLVYRLGSLGDTIIALPAFHRLRELLPGAHITVLTNQPVHSKAPALASVLGETGLVNDYLSYPIELRGPRSLWALRQQIAARRFDLCVSLTASRGLRSSLRDWLYFRSCGIRHILGIPLRRRDVQCLRRDGSALHEWEAARLVRRLGSEGTIDLDADRWWDLRLTSTENDAARALLAESGISRPFIAAAPGTKVDAKDWGEERWLEFTAKIAAQLPQLGLVTLGAADEAERCEKMARLWLGPAASLAGRCSPRVCAALLRHAQVFVGHDSGPMHLAAAVGRPCVAIFSSRGRLGQWFPRGRGHTILYHEVPCQGCQLSVCEKERKRCLTGISADSVVHAVLAQLRDTAGGPTLTPAPAGSKPG